jgi:NAD(P)H-dependent FMN reductase
MADLPHFNPDHDTPPRHPAVAGLRAAMRAADAVVFSTPEYAGALPGSFKNLLDWTIGDDQPRSIYDKPVGWVNSSSRGAVGAYRSLHDVLSYAHAVIVDAACVDIPVSPSMIGGDGMVSDMRVRASLAQALGALGNAACAVRR